MVTDRPCRMNTGRNVEGNYTKSQGCVEVLRRHAGGGLRLSYYTGSGITMAYVAEVANLLRILLIHNGSPT
jgi:hypothetical protein